MRHSSSSTIHRSPTTDSDIRDLGFALATIALKENRFRRVRQVKEKDRVIRKDHTSYVVSYGSLTASEGKNNYIIQLRIRHTYKKNGNLNKRYRLTDSRFKGNFHDDAALAESQFGAHAYWMAVQIGIRPKGQGGRIDLDRYNVFFDSLTRLVGKLSIPMANPREHYRCLAWHKSISQALNKHGPTAQLLDSSTILHISDLHFRELNEASIARSRLIESLEEDRRHIDYIVISGDIADKCRPEGYAAAVDFVIRLADDLGIRKNEITKRVLIVPGNHDVDYSESKRLYSYVPGTPREFRNDDVKVPSGHLHADPTKYARRFKRFNERFFRLVFAQDFPLKQGRQWIRCNSGADDTLLLGFNSAGKIDHFHPKRVELDEDAVSNALDCGKKFLKAKPDGVIIAIMHHPVSGGERSLSRTQTDLFGAREHLVCVLHGDSHRPDITARGLVYGAAPPAIGAGYAGQSPGQLPGGVPWSYHCILLDWIKRRATVESRMREKENGPWIPYTRYRHAGRFRDFHVIGKW